MKTYQDLLEVGEYEQDRIEFVREAITEHKNGELFGTAEIADRYYAGENVTITEFERFFYDAFGRKVIDVWSPNHKIACHYYKYIVRQIAMFVAGNGVAFGQDGTKDKLGKNFDSTLVKLIIDALNDGVSFAFVNNGEVKRFSVREFAPLYDEETGALRAGVRWWKLDDKTGSKPLRATLYEEDGYTEFFQPKDKEMQVYREKRPYLLTVMKSEALGEIVESGMNYPAFPIVPLYNIDKRSELAGNREAIDALDMMVSQLVNNVDAGEAVYWLFRNSDGMSQTELTRALQTIKTAHVASTEDGADIVPHSPVVQFAASHEAIEQLRRQIFDNMQGLDVKEIAGGAATATQIRAAYEPLNTKADLLVMCLCEFINGLLEVLGIDDKPTFTPSYIINQNENIQTIVAAGAELPQEYKTRKILETLGDTDRADKVVAQLIAEDMARMQVGFEE